jgi:hypothetical protein
MKTKVRTAAKRQRSRKRSAQTTSTRPLVYPIPVAGAMAGLNRSASYEAARRGEMPLIQFGKLKKVLAGPWHQMLGE